jgi:hypothetical protein
MLVMTTQRKTIKRLESNYLTMLNIVQLTLNCKTGECFHAS